MLAVSAGDRLVDLRDRAVLLKAFAPGGRRHSEGAGLRVEDLVDEEPVRANSADEHSPLLPCLMIHLGRTRTTSAEDDEHLVLIGSLRRHHSRTRTWMALLMGTVTAIIMMIFIWSMYKHKTANAVVIAARVVVSPVHSGWFAARVRSTMSVT
jgi:hypothetical protein